MVFGEIRVEMQGDCQPQRHGRPEDHPSLLVTKLQLGNAVREAPASGMLGKLELPLKGSQAPAWEPGQAGAWEPGNPDPFCLKTI